MVGTFAKPLAATFLSGDTNANGEAVEVPNQCDMLVKDNVYMGKSW